MAQSRKQDTTTGNGFTKTPILANENDHTEAQSKQSQPSTSIAEGSTKPLSVTEALSLLQTLCSDLQSMDCKTTILARRNRLYIISSIPASIGLLTTTDTGHIALDGKPVSIGNPDNGSWKEVDK